MFSKKDRLNNSELTESVRSIASKALRVACVSVFELTFVTVDTACGLGRALVGVYNDAVREAKK